MVIFNGKTHYKWPFSIAMLVYQRVLHGTTKNIQKPPWFLWPVVSPHLWPSSDVSPPSVRVNVEGAHHMSCGGFRQHSSVNQLAMGMAGSIALPVAGKSIMAMVDSLETWEHQFIDPHFYVHFFPQGTSHGKISYVVHKHKPEKCIFRFFRLVVLPTSSYEKNLPSRRSKSMRRYPSPQKIGFSRRV